MSSQTGQATSPHALRILSSYWTDVQLPLWLRASKFANHVLASNVGAVALMVPVEGNLSAVEPNMLTSMSWERLSVSGLGSLAVGAFVSCDARL